MTTRTRRTPRRAEALTREQIVEAATAILDADGESALTLRTLTTALSTGYGAIYHHVASKDDVLAAAVDDVVARALDGVADTDPRHALRALALGLFDAIVAHPWAGARIAGAPWRPPMADVYETVATQVTALGVPEEALGDAVGALVNYVLGVAGQNAANARFLAEQRVGRQEFLAAVAAQWERLDPARYPRLHRATSALPEHDDRAQFLAGVDLILAGVAALHGNGDP